LRIDPSTKNRLAQAVLDKITLEKKGRFLQKLNKKELFEATERGDESKLIKARAMSIMDTAMTPLSASGEASAASVDASNEKATATTAVYYKIIPEKQILAKIKQTFRFLRDQNVATNAEKHRQRVRRVAGAAARCGAPPEQQSLSASCIPGGSSIRIPCDLSSTGAIAATYALIERMGAAVVMNHPASIGPSPLPEQLNFNNRGNVTASSNGNASSNRNLWAATRNLNNIVASSASSMSINAMKTANNNGTLGSAMDYSAVASRLLCDLPQPKRILSNSDTAATSSLLQGSSLAAGMRQIVNSSNKNKTSSSIDISAKRLLEELTLSRLANLQKQREDTINAYLAMERSTGAALGSARISNTLSAIDVAGNTPVTIPSQQVRLLLNMNATTTAAAADSTHNALSIIPAVRATAMGGLNSGNSSEPLSLFLQLKNNNSGRNVNQRNPSTGNHALSAFNSF